MKYDNHTDFFFGYFPNINIMNLPTWPVLLIKIVARRGHKIKIKKLI